MSKVDKQPPAPHATSAQILAIVLPALSLEQLLLVRKLMHQAMEHLCPSGEVTGLTEKRTYAMGFAIARVEERIKRGGSVT